MKLSVLVDNSTIIDRYFLGEPAVSYYIEDRDTRVLFDVGYSDAFLQNAVKLGVDPLDSDYLVLSHGHIDHTGGLEPLLKLCMERRFLDKEAHCPEIVAHPALFTPKVMEDYFSIGVSVCRRACEAHTTIRESREPLWLSDRLVFLGEIERNFDFEDAGPIGFRREEEGDVPDDLPDDTAIAYIAEEGLVVITGCSHAGICNIVEQAKKVTGVERVYDIIGGFHLLDPPQEKLEGTVQYLSSLELPQLSACHCTDFASRLRLDRVAPLREVGSGLQIEY